MRAIWVENQQVTVREDAPTPQPGPGEALVRVRLAGICATDLEVMQGYAGFSGVLGHEFVGEVAAAPGVPRWVGKRVVGEINLACGECKFCRRGLRTHCTRRSVIGIRHSPGCFAEYLLLPLENLHAVPQDLPDECAVFTEPLAAALQIQQQVAVRPEDRVVVIGAGRLGMLIAWSLAQTGCRLEVVARRAPIRRLLAESGIRSLTPAELAAGSADLVVEVTGSAEGLALAMQAVRARGVIVLKSTFHAAAPLNLSMLVVDEVTLIGSRCGPFDQALAWMQAGRIDPRPLIAARYPLEAGLHALTEAARPGVLKVLLEVSRG